MPERLGEPMRPKACTSRQAFRPLTKDEIDRRIDTLVQRIAEPPGGERTDASPDCRPRWISAAELVRRMRPFLGRN
jgi:hypothetical protein